MHEQRWILGESWRLVVEETEGGWRLREAVGSEDGALVPPRWIDATGAFGESSEEVLLRGRSREWSLRLYPGRRVLAARSTGRDVLELPEGWWSEEDPEAAPWIRAVGPPGTSSADLIAAERRGWDRRLMLREGASASDRIGFGLVSNWNRVSASFGDTEVLHRLAPRDSSREVRERLNGEGRMALDCRGLFHDSDGERDLSDALLFAHQEFGATWLALEGPPSPILERALDRAHMDAQGELFAAWILPGPDARGRSSWRRLGPCLRRSPVDSDCYVWER